MKVYLVYDHWCACGEPGMVLHVFADHWQAEAWLEATRGDNWCSWDYEEFEVEA